LVARNRMQIGEESSDDDLRDRGWSWWLGGGAASARTHCEGERKGWE